MALGLLKQVWGIKMREIDFDSIEKEVRGKRNIIYGAGCNGKTLCSLLCDKGVSVQAFYDDDRS